MGEMKPTPGPWYAKNQVVYTDAMPKRFWGDAKQYSGPYIVMQTGLYSSPDDATTYANARLVAEAGTVFHNTGLSPVQLVEMVKELKAALCLMVRTHDEPAESLLQEVKEQQWLDRARAALAKCEGVK